jgi:DNA invertase Pin-like site-specific DNA recombinase
MFGMLGVFAEFERAMIQERMTVGMPRARAESVGRRSPWRSSSPSERHCRLAGA